MKNQTIKKLLSISLLLVLSGFVQAQQQVQNSLYMFNPGIVNPAYAGSRDALNAVVDYRQQWTGWDGAPKTAMVSINSPLKVDAVALGFNLVNDQIGSTTNTAIYGDFAYRIRLNKRKDRLSFGIRAGGDYMTAGFNNLRTTDASDNIAISGNYKKFAVNVGAGIYYYGKRFYLGFSVPQLVANKMSDLVNFKATQVPHYYLVAGYVFHLNSVIDFKPSVQLKYTQNAPLSVEANASFFFYNKVWLGAMYRHGAAAGANILFQINEMLRIGYAYDFTTSAMTQKSPSSHEIMLGIDLRGKRTSFKTPRYF